MHIKAGQIAFSGLLAAFSVLCVVLGSIVEMSTLFFICGGAFCVGIAVREWGLRYGAAFLLASSIAGMLVAPNKMHCITFTAMGLYLWASEVLRDRIGKASRITSRESALWLGRYIIFNVMYIPAILFAPRLFIAGRIEGAMWIAVWVSGQAGVIIFEKAHDYFQVFIWGRMRRYLIKW